MSTNSSVSRRSNTFICREQSILLYLKATTRPNDGNKRTNRPTSRSSYIVNDFKAECNQINDVRNSLTAISKQRISCKVTTFALIEFLFAISGQLQPIRIHRLATGPVMHKVNKTFEMDSYRTRMRLGGLWHALTTVARLSNMSHVLNRCDCL